ncbi:MAG: GEVED domain-containing protein, partial [Bacteroidales bacterium]|nr:GEVED domain-containing protein [Bacteroidales bacterium]
MDDCEFFIWSQPDASQGTLIWGPEDGTFSFIPTPGFVGTFCLLYNIIDTTGLSDEGTYCITVGPLAVDDYYGTNINTPVGGDVTLNDYYEPGSSFSQLTSPSNGQVTFNPDGTFTYTPDLNYSGDDSFTYEVCLPSPYDTICDPATVYITMDGTADMGIAKAVDNTTPDVGSEVEFSLTITNNGPNIALDVEVTDILPSGYAYVSDNGNGAFDDGTGIWTVGNVLKDSSKTLTITALVLASGDYENIAEVTTSSNDPVPGNNIDTVETTPVPQADLTITKIADNPSQNVGNDIVFTLEVTNDGPSDATNVEVEDLLPDGYTYVSDNSGGDYNSVTGIWTIGNLAYTQSVSIEITATILASGDYENSCIVTADEDDPIPANNYDTLVPVPGAVADLKIIKTADNMSPVVGTYIEFTLMVTNLGPSNASSVVAHDTLPSGYTYVSDDGGSATSESGGIITWTIGNLLVGDTLHLKILALVNASGNYTNKSNIGTNDQPDPDLTNNESDITPVVTPQADLSINKTVNNNTPVIGTDIVFTLSVTNYGLSDAEDVSVEDVLPAGYTYVSHTAPSHGSFNSGTGLWSIGDFGYLDVATLAITATVNASGSYVNQAEVTSTTLDIYLPNNSDIESVTPTPVLAITNPAAVCSPQTVNITLPAVTAGSTPGLTYTYWTNAGATIPYATPTAATNGTYYIKGTTTLGGYSIQPVIVTVNQGPTSLGFALTEPSIPGASDGQINLTVNGGSPIYTYYWTKNGTGTPFASTEDLTGLSAATYAVTVTDANMCSISDSKELDDPDVCYDFGDAPDPTYPTLNASNGAKHINDYTTYLGSTIDCEADGQPNSDATGDDANTDDEDGVTFNTSLNQGDSASITVNASVTGNLSAWIDFNADGDWADAGEQIFADSTMSAGNNNLNFYVPCAATVGNTFMRFRFSTDNGLSYTGTATNGEVEDYIVALGADNTDPIITTCPITRNLEGCSPDEITGPAYSTTEAASTYTVFSNGTNQGVATDNCGITSVTYIDVAAGTCPIVVTRTWTLKDAAGNSETCEQTINVDDNTDPTASNPAAITGIKCISAVPAPDITVVTDEADNCGAAPTVAWVSDANNGGTGCAADPYIVTRTYSVTDACGNAINVEQTITVIDDVDPTASNPAPITGIKCIANVPVPDISVVTDEADNCGAAPTVAFVSDANNGGTGCAADPYIVTRTYSVTDACGNSINVEQTITVIDDVDPTASNPAAITGIKCISAVPAPDITVVTDEADNCGAAPTVAFVSDANNGGTGCATDPYIVTRTYSVTDACGNSIKVEQTITVIDDVDPTASNPAAITGIKCISAVPAPDITVVTDEADNCGAAPTVAWVSDANNGGTGCTADPYIVTRTYSVTDACGNSINVEQTITVIDDVNPTASNPAPVTGIKCIANVPVPDISVVTDEADNCGAAPTVAWVSDANNGGTGCATDPYIVTRTYSVTDACGNAINVEQTITVIDDVDPTASNPAAITGIKCISAVPAPDITVVTDEADNCGAAPTVAFVSDANNGGTGCAADPYIVTRTYSVTDACGNAIAVEQTITVIDDVNPTASNPAAITGIKCISAVPAPDITVVTDEADNCGAAPTVAWVSDANNGGTGCAADPYIVTRTYSVTDACGNSINVEQTITVIDDVDPTASNPAPVTGIKCIANVPVPDISVVTDEADNCGAAPTVAWVSDANNGGTGCTADPYIVTRTYSVTDACGNAIAVEQTITVIDDVNPTASNPAAITGIKCISAVPAPDITVVTDEADNCGAAPTVAFVSDANNGGTGCAADPYIVTRTYSVTDACGNAINVEQTITVIDDVNPTASNPAPVTGIKCITNVPAPDISVVTDEADNCGAAPTVAFVSDANNGGTGCAADPYIVTRTYSVT